MGGAGGTGGGGGGLATNGISTVLNSTFTGDGGFGPSAQQDGSRA